MSVHQHKKTKRWYVNHRGKFRQRGFEGNRLLSKTQAKNFEVLVKVRFSSIQSDMFYYDLLEIYLDFKKQRTVRSSYSESSRIIRKTIKPLVPNKRISQFTPRDFLSFESEMLASTYSTKYKNATVSYLKKQLYFRYKVLWTIV